MRRKVIFGVRLRSACVAGRRRKPRPRSRQRLATDGTPVVSNDTEEKVVCTTRHWS